MAKLRSLNELVKFNSSFRNAINLYLNLNKEDKILSYIPTTSSIKILNEYLQSIDERNNLASLLIGPYGKGKSHLLLVLMAIATLERNKENKAIIDNLIAKIEPLENVGKKSIELIQKVWNKKKYLPVIVMASQGDLNQAFLYALHEALKRDGKEDLVPDTYYSMAEERILDWKENYTDTYELFEDYLKEYERTADEFIAELRHYSKEMLDVFKKIYPKLTSGSDFNPLAASEVTPLYKSVCEKLCYDYDYSGIYIIFDEFSKFIEGQDKLYTGNNMLILQEICELANESKQIYITMVTHKSIKEYGKYLSQEVINAFTGIEGRIAERYFVTSSKNNYELIQNAILKNVELMNEVPQYQMYLGEEAVDKYYDLPPFKTNFKREDFERIILRGCYPLNPITAYLLLNVSEKVAQNERTLFTFISKDEPYSMARYVKLHNDTQPWSIGADLIYDYFSGLFKKDVTNEFIHREWLSAEYAISKCNSEEQKKMVKALAIVLIVNKEEEIPASDRKLQLAVNYVGGEEVLKQLEELKIIYMKHSTNSYVFKTRAGSELRKEIKRQKEIKGSNINIPKILLDVTGDYYIIPKKYNTEHSMTRYFRHEFMCVDDFLNIHDANAFFEKKENADGKMISLFSFNDKIRDKEIKGQLKKFCDERLIVRYSTIPFLLFEQAKEYEVIQELKENNIFFDDNEILLREIPLMLEDLASQLMDAVSKMYENRENYSVYYVAGKRVVEEKSDSAETAVNICCEKIYNRTPIINNEMINRQEINTGATKKARKTIIEAILNHKDNEDFYSGTNQEATVYRALFKNTGILAGKPDANINEVMEIMNGFVEDCAVERLSFDILFVRLTAAPYGMRRGVIPLYWSYVLANRMEDIIIYFYKKEVELTADIVLNMCENPSDYFLFVSKEEIEKEKYIKNLQKCFRVQENLNLTDFRINDILICMQRWFRALPQVTRNINIVEDYKYATGISIYLTKIRALLQRADANPYEIIFENIPASLESVGDYGLTFDRLEKCKLAFDRYYDWILEKAVDCTYAVFGCNNNGDLYHLLKEWYERQSNVAKKELQGNDITTLMNYIERLEIYDDLEITRNLVRIVMGVYVENWSGDAGEDYIIAFKQLKEKIESIKDNKGGGEYSLIFTSKSGSVHERRYTPVDENVAPVLRNTLEDVLEEFDDLSVNDRVAILLEMIEKTITRRIL